MSTQHSQPILPPVLQQHRLQILALARTNGVTNVRVFGSMARGDFSDNSDVDLLVDIETGRSGFALGGFLMDVSELLHRKVDVVTPKALHHNIHDQILREALSL